MFTLYGVILLQGAQLLPQGVDLPADMVLLLGVALEVGGDLGAVLRFELSCLHWRLGHVSSLRADDGAVDGGCHPPSLFAQPLLQPHTHAADASTV